MALPTIILRNTTGADIALVQLAVTVPMGGSVTVSESDLTFEVLKARLLVQRIKESSGLDVLSL